ncbi:Siphovirus Gp157 [uncultured Caudovirales phage]|uniref:Siphovirus Gp157 n=1 Tax=uncultured Caudovirales phage TaxID=2100421 RepID=A0A6J5M2X4_9CAUD|nr:Siphovirus Gp157 [uncultured Caudovirales phage]
MLPSLYQIAEEFRQTAIALSNMDLDEQTLRDTLEGCTGDLEAKSTNIVKFTQSLLATAESIKQAEAEMAKRRKALENRAARVIEYVKSCMELAGVQKIECPYFMLSIRENPGKVEITDITQIPVQYTRLPEPPTPEPDKKAIADAIKSGVVIPGAQLVKTTRLEVK